MQADRRGSIQGRGAAFAQVLALAVLLPGALNASGSAEVRFATSGGDAWTFAKRIEAVVPPGLCDEVVVTSPAGVVRAAPDGERFKARVPLLAGTNAVRAECLKDGKRQGEPAQQEWVVRLNAAPKARIRAMARATELTLDGRVSEPAEARPAPIARYEWRAREGTPAPIAGLPATGERIAFAAPAQDGDYFVTLRVTDAHGRSDESTAMFWVREGIAQTLDVAAAPAWIDGAVIYGVVPSLFGAHGFPDVMARLDDLAALGVTVLWLSPVTAAPAGDFGYAVTDHFRLRQGFGSEDEFRALVEAAHARGMRVIMDFVPNHVSEQNRYFADAATRRQASPYFRFFERTIDGEPTHYFEWRNLKNLNFGDAEVRRLITEAFTHWVRAFDVDGFRVDVAWGPRERAPDFWPRWREDLKRIKPDLLLLAEASTRDPYYVRNGFDAAYDWTDKLGEWAWKDAFEDESRTAQRLRAAIAASQTDPLARVLRFLNNNDTGARFVTRYGPGRTRVATVMLVTLPGIPSLFTGDEVGAEFEPYKEPAPLRWDDNRGLRELHTRLLHLRRAHAALTSNAIEFLDVAPQEPVLAYTRPGRTVRESIVVLLNFGATPTTVTLPQSAIEALGGTLRDLLTGERAALADGSVRVAGHGVRILRAE